MFTDTELSPFPTNMEENMEMAGRKEVPREKILVQCLKFLPVLGRLVDQTARTSQPFFLSPMKVLVAL